MSLFTSLRSTAESLSAFDKGLTAIQNNVANASTPGYAKQQVVLESMEYGGVRAGPLVSARDQFAEQSVRRQVSTWGFAQQQTDSLTALQGVFDISGNSGIPKALNNLFDSFSSWSQNAEDTGARQMVLDRASDVASAFQQTAADLASSARDTELQLDQTVNKVNDLVGQLKTANSQAAEGLRDNSALDTQINSVLEQLSEYIDFTTQRQSDGTVTVLMNGQTPLITGQQQSKLSFRMDQPTSPPPTITDEAPPQRAFITASDGTDITAATVGGRLGALLDVRNSVLPSYIGDAYQPGSLNKMAQQFADCVNNILQSGQVSGGTTPVMGTPIFKYTTTDNKINLTQIAENLAVDSSVGPSQLAAMDPGPPAVANGIPLELASMSEPTSDAERIDGISYSAYFGKMAADVGSKLSNATGEAQTAQSMVTQAKSLREQISGVSLDEEAALMIQFQRAYEANSRLITVLDQLTSDTIQMLQP